MVSHITAAVAGIASTYVFLWALLHFTQDPKEPPTVHNTIPFLSPLFGMISKGNQFHSYLRDVYKQPICTLRLPGSRLYIINDTSLIPVMQRQVRTLSVSVILVRVFSHFMGVSNEALDIMGRDPIENHGFVHQITVETVKGLDPGPILDDLNKKAVNILNTSLGDLGATGTPTTVNMFEWASYQIMMATTTAIYGPRNPFKSSAVRDAFYKLEAGLVTLIVGFLPSVLARQSLRARDLITDAFMKYYNDGGLDEDSSVYAQNRYEYPSKLGVSRRDVAKMEAGGSIGLVSNTMPATFWTLYHIFSDPAVLEDCRREVARAVHEKDGQKYLDLAYIKKSCPIILSTMQEAFRFYSLSTSVRSVEEDHMLGGKYLLKKGNTVMIPGTVQHTSTEAWGPNINEFQHKRFVKEPGLKKHNPTAFRVFGGGSTLCPGRHFATTEILAFASVILLRFDVKPVGGTWDTAGCMDSLGFRIPKRDLKVQLTPRDNMKWHLFFSVPGKPLEVSVEDIEAASGKLNGDYLGKARV